MAEIVEPTVRAMAAAGMPYSGVLYAGADADRDGPSLIEYNAALRRSRDPGADAADRGRPAAAAAGDGERARWPTAAPPRLSDETALTVVLAARGYPATPRPVRDRRDRGRRRRPALSSSMPGRA
jgi:phosphoribosylamine--glycine ligase